MSTAIYCDAPGVHKQFEAQAREAPAAPALTFEGRTITYGALNDASDYLSRALAKRGVGDEAIVGVMMERSDELITVLLAALKAGAAYLPLDPDTPTERLEYIVQNSGAAVLITDDSAHHETRGCGSAIRFSELAAGAEEGNRPAPIVESGSLAYAIYTSGSTGRPKGVAVSHGALASMFASMIPLLKLTPEDRWLASTTVSFDIAALEWLLPLTMGCHSVIASREESREPRRLMQLAKQANVSIIQATPSMWRLIMGAASVPPSVRLMLCGGEVMTRELANQLTGVRGAETWNLYGPTETTIWSTAHKLRAAYQETPPIGRALSNTQVYVLNGDLRPVEPGAEGELYLGGAGLARGYIARPDLTAERFVPSPFAAADGERLYRTGDLVRISPDGELEFTGRKDNQVKVRGHRIEPGEIEAELRGMAGIADAAVICRADNSGNNSLVAYVVAARNVPVSASALRAGLQTRLPDYMIPSGFVELRELPLTPNGKTDRRALAALGEGGGVQYHAPYSAPATPTERTIAELWASVLDLDYVGVNDDFFELGGHSLLAVEVLLRLEEATRRRISLQQFFENPILNTLAELIDSLPPLAEEREPYELEL